MEPGILLLVLLAAVLHASWNALVKIGGDVLLRLALIHASASLCATPILFWVPIPEWTSWPYLLGSVAVHQAYYLLLAFSYRVGDLSHVYPIARGSAPLLVAVGGFLFADERLSPLGMAAVAIISVAILSLAAGGRWQHDSRKAVLFAFGTGLTIAVYTLLDGLGGRLAGDVLSYIAWLFFLEGIPLMLWVLLLSRRQLVVTLKTNWQSGVSGGLFAMSAYGLVIWAMSLTPMSYVSALRETSVIVAAWIGTRLLREPFGGQRLGAAVVVALGVVLLQVSRAK